MEYSDLILFYKNVLKDQQRQQMAAIHWWKQCPTKSKT